MFRDLKIILDVIEHISTTLLNPYERTQSYRFDPTFGTTLNIRPCVPQNPGNDNSVSLSACKSAFNTISTEKHTEFYYEDPVRRCAKSVKRKLWPKKLLVE